MITNAYQVLSNPSSKANYDQKFALQSNNSASQTYAIPAQPTKSSRLANAATTIKNANRFNSSQRLLTAPQTTSAILKP